jgi:hypothetical protein
MKEDELTETLELKEGVSKQYEIMDIITISQRLLFGN